MESETTEILHCPFCGSRCAARGAVGSRWVFCTDDDVCGYVGTEGPDAIAAHNTVAAAVRDHAAAVAERDALRAQVGQLRVMVETAEKHCDSLEGSDAPPSGQDWAGGNRAGLRSAYRIFTTARLGSRVVTESEVRAFCAAVGLPYPLPGGTNDGPIDNDDRPTRTGHGVRLSPRRRRLGGASRAHRAGGSGVAAMKATPPAVEPLTVRDARRRERRHAAVQLVLFFVAVFAATIIGLWGSWDRQPLGERRSAAQEAMER